MSIPEGLMRLIGKWQGENRLWLEPDQPTQKSKTTASITPVVQGKFLSLRYTWADQGQSQEGLLLLGQGRDQITAAWADSWHMGDEIMLCTGQTSLDEKVSVQGSYAVPSGPDWGWRISIEHRADDRFRLVMDNISPQGEEMLAVIAEYERQI